MSSWQLNCRIPEVHRHLDQTRNLPEFGNSNQTSPFSGSLGERRTRVSARSESFRGKTLKRRDSLADEPVRYELISFDLVVLMGFAAWLVDTMGRLTKASFGRALQLSCIS